MICGSPPTLSHLAYRSATVSKAHIANSLENVTSGPDMLIFLTFQFPKLMSEESVLSLRFYITILMS
jgi:hypothetical protein